MGTGAETAGVGENRPLCSLRGRTDTKQSGRSGGAGREAAPNPKLLHLLFCLIESSWALSEQRLLGHSGSFQP